MKIKLADERVGHDLEAECGERLVVVGLTDDLLFHLVGVEPIHRRNIERAGQVVDHRIEQRLNTLVLEGRSAEHREDLHRDGRLAHTRPCSCCIRRRLALEEHVQHLVVVLGDSFDQRMTEPLWPSSSRFGRNLFNSSTRAHRLVVPENRLHRDEIDDARETGFLHRSES